MSVRSVQNARTVFEDDVLNALAVTVYPEVVRACVLTAVQAGTANALHSEANGVNPRSLIKYYPQETAKMILVAQRLGRWYGDSETYRILSHFIDAIETAKSATIALVSAGFVCRNLDLAQGQTLVDVWRGCCGAGIDALRQLHKVLSSHRLTATVSPETELLVLLDRALEGAHGQFDNLGLAIMPDFAERRRFQRVSLRCAAVLIRTSEQVPVIIRDISSVGLGLELKCDLKVGEPVVVRRALSPLISGTVAWSANGRAAVALKQPLFDLIPQLRFCAAPENGKLIRKN